MFRRKNKQYEFKDRKSFGSYLFAPFTFIFQKLGGSDTQLGSDAPLSKRILNKILFLIKFPFWILFQGLIFIVTSWTTTRDGNAAFWGAIPMLGIATVFGVIIMANIMEDRWTKRIHREQVLEAEQNDEPEVALLCSRRVQKINQEDLWQYVHAESVLRAGLVDNALVLVEELASPEQAGFIDAHLLLARELMERRGTAEEKQKYLQTAKQHLLRVRETEPPVLTANISSFANMRKIAVGREAFVRLGDVHYELGEVDEAMKIYEQVSGLAPRIVPLLAQYHIDKGQLGQAEYHVRRGVESIRRTLETDPNQAKLWEQLYEILMVTNNHQVALDQLNIAARQTTDNAVRQQIRRLQSKVLLGFSQLDMDLSSRDNFRRRLILVCRAIQVFPRNGDALSDWISLVVFPENEEVKSWIDDEARDNVEPSIFHVIHGVRDAIEGKPGTSQEHFAMAFGGDSRTAIIINDIAFLIAMDKERPEDALKLIDRAIESWPTSAKLYQTRGEILMKLGELDRAVEELEYAASVIDRDFRVFLVLAECYRKMGREKDAQVQEEKARAKYQEMYGKEGRILRNADESKKDDSENEASINEGNEASEPSSDLESGSAE